MFQDSPSGDVTQLLAEWARGDRAALGAATSLVYTELHRIAESYVQSERSNHTLQPTALIHEAYMRLVKEEDAQFENRRKFFAFAARLMRQILVDHARTRNAGKRGGGEPKVALESMADALPQPQCTANASTGRATDLRHQQGP